MNDAPRDSNQLALDRTDLAWARSVMALEGTMMAWIRTSLSLIGFGFTIFKFLEAMQKSGSVLVTESAPRNLGLFLILLGMGLLSAFIFQFRIAMARIQQFSGMERRVSLSLIGAIGVLTAGLLALLNILFSFGGF
jgi:putative membrane protein